MGNQAETRPKQAVVPCRQPTAAGSLQALGFPPLAAGAAFAVSRKVSVRDVLDDAGVARRLARFLQRHAKRRAAVCLSVSDFGADGDVSEAWQAFCDRLRPAGARPGFCIHSHQMPLRDFCRIADATLGSAPRYVYLDSLQMLPHKNRGVDRRSADNWRMLWRQRAAARTLAPCYGGFVRSACPLLSDEVADSVLPAAGLHVPRQSAWLPLALPLAGHADAHGRLDETALCHRLRLALSLADRLQDEQRWAAPGELRDARMNRRIAFVLSGLGELVRRRRADPADLACLDDMAGLVDRIRATLMSASRDLAIRKGAAPALQQACRAQEWFDGHHADSWSSRFDEARRKLAIRHRNLLAMSPYSVLPPGAACRPEYTDLLPLIAGADAWSFSGAPGFAGWTVGEFRHFHRRARAVIQGSLHTSRIAAGA
jgi:hypothetical protein